MRTLKFRSLLILFFCIVSFLLGAAWFKLKLFPFYRGYTDKLVKIIINDSKVNTTKETYKNSNKELSEDKPKTQKHIVSAYHRILITKKDLSNILWNYWGKGQKPVGYIDLINDNDILLVSGMGKIYKISSKNLSLRELKTNLDEIIESFEYDRIKSTGHCTGCMSIRDIYIDNSDSKNGIPNIYVSYIKTKYPQSNPRCYTLAVARANFYSFTKSINFKEIFDTKKCIPRYFNFHDSGGRILILNKRNFLLTVGDYMNDKLTKDINSPYGKILKVNIEDSSYKIFSLGHRNPQGLFKDENGEIYSTEHGPRGGDELNIIKEGNNYGWSYTSYGTDYDGRIKKKIKSHGKYTEPLYFWSPAIAPSQLIIYHGDEFHRWKNNILVSSLRDESLHRLTYKRKENRIVSDERIDLGCRIRDIKTDQIGKLYLLCEDPSIIKLEVDQNDFN